MNYEEFLNTDIHINYGGEDLGTVKAKDFIIQRAFDVLQENGIYPDDVYRDGSFYLCVSISWGDWKHEHAFTDYLMSQVIGYELHHIEVTEEDGSDCYSAVHYYVTKELMKAVIAFRGE